MSDSNQCPKCKLFILGDYCHGCKIDLTDALGFSDSIFSEIFGEDDEINISGDGFFGDFGVWCWWVWGWGGWW